MTDFAVTLPTVGTPIVEANGQINEVWFRFFLTLLQRTGGEAGSELPRLIKLIDLLLRRFVAAQGESGSVVAVPVRPLGLVPDAVPVRRNSPADAPDVVSVRRPAPTDSPDQVFRHGLQNDPDLHALVTTTAAGFMSASDKVKIDSQTNDAGDWARVAKASLPAAQASRIGWRRYVTDATGSSGIVPAYCDGTTWKRFSDDSAVN